MKPALSLEEEKRRLLEQLENSRAVYRRMLTGTPAPAHEETSTVFYDGYPPVGRYPRRFPQSRTMQWIMDHPYLFAAGAVAVAAAAKKGLSKSASNSASGSKTQPKHEPDNDHNANLKKGIAATTLGTSLATTAAMVLRNPAQMRAVMRAIGVAVNYYKSRSRDPRQRFE